MVAFSVKFGKSGAYGPFNEEETVKYDTVITNIGDAYSPDTGVFTAPVAGVYHFTFFYHAGGNCKSRLVLTKNNHQVVETLDHPSSSGSNCGGNAAVLQLQKQDEVSVRLLAHTHVWGTGGVTTFSGFLVHPS